MNNPIDTVLSRLDGVRDKGNGQYVARCPAHQDKSPSLAIKLCDDGRVLLHCHSSCPNVDVVSAIGMRLSDLFPHKGIIRTKEKFAPRAIERTLVHELYVLQIAIGMRHDNEPVHADDAGRETLAVNRIKGLLKEVYG